MIRWRHSNFLLILLSIITLFFFLAGMSWMFFTFDIPIIHSGDTALVRSSVFFYWIIVSIFIFGFEVRE